MPKPIEDRSFSCLHEVFCNTRKTLHCEHGKSLSPYIKIAFFSSNIVKKRNTKKKGSVHLTRVFFRNFKCRTRNIYGMNLIGTVHCIKQGLLFFGKDLPHELVIRLLHRSKQRTVKLSYTLYHDKYRNSP